MKVVEKQNEALAPKVLWANYEEAHEALALFGRIDWTVDDRILSAEETGDGRIDVWAAPAYYATPVTHRWQGVAVASYCRDYDKVFFGAPVYFCTLARTLGIASFFPDILNLTEAHLDAVIDAGGEVTGANAYLRACEKLDIKPDTEEVKIIRRYLVAYAKNQGYSEFHQEVAGR